MKEKNNFEFPIISMSQIEYRSITKWISSYKKNETDHQTGLYIYGAGIRGNVILKLLEANDVKVCGFCDGGAEKQGGYVREYRIYSPDEIADGNNLILVSPENGTEIENYLCQKGYEKNKNYFVIDNGMYDTYENEFFQTNKSEYILFGDCVFTEVDVSDFGGDTLGMMAEKMIGNGDTRVLSIHGMCTPGFYHLMRLQLLMGIRPKAVAFIVNIPFCNGIQTKLPQSQHFELFDRIKNRLDFQDDEFNAYVELTKKRSGNINATGFSSKSGMSGKSVEKAITKMRYMYTLKADNENIQYAVNLIEMLNEYGIKAIPFIPAINASVGTEFFGEDFLNKYNLICDGIKEITKNCGAEVLDMSHILSEEDFFGGIMTKFPNKSGKIKVINKLKEHMED